ncbi:restriction endonuclease subunit S [Azotobacter salinestris]|uniref:restriction endonuclease subunit S n=1 Tax=Azotobacter salinestris TaxID=69964 RepID=UPI0032DE340F
MSFPKYPAYKDSGVEWLGKVPEHWTIFSLKRSVDGCTNGLWGDEPDGENDIAVIRVADFDRGTSRVGLDKLTYRSITQRERASRLLQHGDLLIEKSGGGEKTLVGCVVLFVHDIQAITSNFVARMRPLMGFDSGFLCYAFDSLYQGKVNYPAIKQTTGIQNLDSEAYLQERFCFPPRAEQTQIARFLDHETARIDALIEEQQRLIELLKEKRQAVISRAVTKGLDPRVPMKDSGVEWLGEVPAHWVVSRVKRECAVKGRIGFRGYTTDDLVDAGDGALVLGATQINDIGDICLDEPVYISWGKYYESPEIMVESGDVLVVQRGSTCGKVGFVRGEFGPLTINPSLVLLNKFSCVPEYVFRFLSSGLVQRLLNSVTGNTAIPMLSQEQIGNVALCLPPVAEQLKISEYIATVTEKLDRLVSEAFIALTTLEERRSALISAAVTGKIDLRGWQPPASTTASIREKEIA